MALFEKMRPLGDRVLVQRIEADDKTPGGIISYLTQRKKRRRQAKVASLPMARLCQCK
ncbi:MAG TPA: hypothetical protein VJ201_01175 [Candidatus Babeliales bacterium]|nr:hypothetical protein [Candidatus Babeliales bacterium]